MASKPIIDLLIIGSGPVGLTAAIEAQRLGLSFRIIERKEKRRTNDSRAVVVHPRVMELLETHPRVIRDVRAQADELPCANIEFVNEKTTINISREEQQFGDTDYTALFFLPQYLTEKCLEDELNEGGGEVEYGVAFEGLTQSGGEVTAKVQLASGEHEDIAAKYVAGADGGRSKVRDSVGISLDRHSSDLFFVLSDLKLGENSPDKNLPGGHVMLTSDGPVAMISLPGGSVRFFALTPEGISNEDDVTLDKEFFEKRILETTGKRFEVELGEWQTIFEVTHGVSNAYREGHVFLAGDAAHVHSPIGGQGMNYGIWDAVTLVSKIAWAERVLEDRRPAAREAAEEILASYAEERHALGRELVSKVKLATSVVTTRNRTLQWMRNALMRYHIPRVKMNLMRAAGQLDLEYRPDHSRYILPAPTSWFTSKSYVCHPGQRLPNLVLDDGSKLYERIDRARHTWVCVNLTSPPGGDAADRRVYVAPAREQASVPAIAEETLTRPQAVLVRPDLFVAAVGDSLEGLEAAVEEAFGAECYAAM